MSKYMVVTKCESWDEIPNGANITLLGLSHYDAWNIDKAHFLNQVFIKRKPVLTVKAKKDMGPLKKDQVITFGFGIKIKYESSNKKKS